MLRKLFLAAAVVSLALAANASAVVISGTDFDSGMNGWGLWGCIDPASSGGNPGAAVVAGPGNPAGALTAEVSTVGYTDITVKYDVKATGTGAEYSIIYYLDGKQYAAELNGNSYVGTWGEQLSVALPAEVAGQSAIEIGFETWCPAGVELYLDNVSINGLPEPATLALLGMGLLVVRRRRVA